MSPKDERRLDRMRSFQEQYARPMTVTELAHVFQWSTGGARNFVDRMRRHGLVDDRGRVVA